MDRARRERSHCYAATLRERSGFGGRVPERAGRVDIYGLWRAWLVVLLTDTGDYRFNTWRPTLRPRFWRKAGLD